MLLGACRNELVGQQLHLLLSVNHPSLIAALAQPNSYRSICLSLFYIGIPSTSAWGQQWLLLPLQWNQKTSLSIHLAMIGMQGAVPVSANASYLAFLTQLLYLWHRSNQQLCNQGSCNLIYYAAICQYFSQRHSIPVDTWKLPMSLPFNRYGLPW